MTSALRSLRVLVVDDEALLLWSIAETLRRHGHSVVEAASASDVREFLADSQELVDVVLLDYRLPDSNDLRLLEEIRRRLPQSAVILMTAYGSPEVVEGALRLGASDVVGKPFDLHAMELLIRRVDQEARTRA